MRPPWSIALILVAAAGLVYLFARPSVPLPAPKEKESRRHPAPPADLQAVNQHIGQDVASARLERMDGQLAVLGSLHKGQPLVLVFFSHDCDCSLEFSRYFAAAMNGAKTKAAWYFVFPDTPEQISGFISKAALSLPALRDPESRLARQLDIAKSGCFILVDQQDKVSAIWPGVSLEGLRDLFSRLSLPPPWPAELPGIPASPTAGCPL